MRCELDDASVRPRAFFSSAAPKQLDRGSQPMPMRGPRATPRPEAPCATPGNVAGSGDRGFTVASRSRSVCHRGGATSARAASSARARTASAAAAEARATPASFLRYGVSLSLCSRVSRELARARDEIPRDAEPFRVPAPRESRDVARAYRSARGRARRRPRTVRARGRDRRRSRAAMRARGVDARGWMLFRANAVPRQSKVAIAFRRRRVITSPRRVLFVRAPVRNRARLRTTYSTGM